MKVRWVILGGFFLGLLFPLSEGKAETLTLDSLASQLQTPEAIQKFMGKHFVYVEDQTLFGQDEYWQSPEEMLERKQGDCEDYALFAEAILKKNGYRTFIFSVYWEDDAHTVAVFEKEGKWGIFDLDDLRYLKGDSIEDLGKAIKHDWSYLGIMRKDGNTGIINRKFQGQKAIASKISLALPSTI
ncbi:MAG: transglutaminase-like cysteine peptidase [Candidatus Omnitrophica bacterium]|nr:transglutaminase-like cysteine peptidase [Candidatus Omnitrophota bacterium]